MSELKFYKKGKTKTEERQGNKQLYVSSENHRKVQDISIESGVPMYEVTKMLIEYALEHVTWGEQ